MSSKVEAERGSHVARATTTENSRHVNGIGSDVELPRGNSKSHHAKGKETWYVEVSPETKQQIEKLCAHLNTTQCALAEGLVQALYQMEFEQSVSGTLLGDRYVFIEFTQQRVTKRLVRTMRGLRKLEDHVTETHGSFEKCWQCEHKPTRVHFHWTTPHRCHRTFACPQHKPTPPRHLARPPASRKL